MALHGHGLALSALLREAELTMTDPSNTDPKGRARPALVEPRKWDPIELVGVFTAHIDNGLSSRAAAELIAKQIKGRLPRNSALRGFDARSIERRFRELKAMLLQPWSDEPIQDGIILGPMLFNGRPVPMPIGLQPQVAPKPGRPRKIRSS